MNTQIVPIPNTSTKSVRALGQNFTIGEDLLELRSSSADLPMHLLRQRLDEDGYLLLRAFHKRADVLAARHEICQALHASGELVPGTDIDHAIAVDGAQGLNMAKRTDQPFEAYCDLVAGQQRLDFFAKFFGEAAMTLDHKWLRTFPPGTKGTNCHCDTVYMSEGSKQLHTIWTPIGDVAYQHGPLMILPGSHRCEAIVNTYGQTNSHQGTPGPFSSDAKRTAELTGCTWSTAEFQAGDILLFGMHLMHASLSNTSKAFRISTDNRYQPAADPVDQRHMGTLNVTPTPGEWLKSHGQALQQA